MSTLLRQHKSLGRVLEYLLKSGKHTSRNFRTSSAEGFAQVKSKRVQQSQSAPRWEPTNPAAFWERTQPHVDSKVNSNLRMSWPGVALRVAGVLGIGLYSAWRCPGLVSPAGWGQELRDKNEAQSSSEMSFRSVGPEWAEMPEGSESARNGVYSSASAADEQDATSFATPPAAGSAAAAVPESSTVSPTGAVAGALLLLLLLRNQGGGGA